MPRSSYRTRQTRKTTLLRQRTDAGKPLEASTAGRIMNELALWHVHAPAARDVLAAIDIHQQTGASFWDAMIVRSAQLPDSVLGRISIPAMHTRESGSAIRSCAGAASVTHQCAWFAQRMVAPMSEKPAATVRAGR